MSRIFLSFLYISSFTLYFWGSSDIRPVSVIPHKLLDYSKSIPFSSFILFHCPFCPSVLFSVWMNIKLNPRSGAADKTTKAQKTKCSACCRTLTEPVLKGIPQSELNIFRSSQTQMVSIHCTFLVTLNYCLMEMTDKAVYSTGISFSKIKLYSGLNTNG